MGMHVLVFAGSRSQLLQHIPVEHAVRNFRAWEPRLVLSFEKRSGFPPDGDRSDGHPGRHRGRHPSGGRQRLQSAGQLML